MERISLKCEVVNVTSSIAKYLREGWTVESIHQLGPDMTPKRSSTGAEKQELMYVIVVLVRSESPAPDPDHAPATDAEANAMLRSWPAPAREQLRALYCVRREVGYPVAVAWAYAMESMFQR